MSDFYTKETIPLDHKFPFDLYYMDSMLKGIAPQLHQHDCWELNYIVSGSGTYFIEDQVLLIKPGDLFLFNNLIYHRAITQNTISMLVFTFDPKILWMNQFEYQHILPFYQGYAYFLSDNDKNTVEYMDILLYLQKIKQEWDIKAEGYPIMIQSSLLRILVTLHRYQAKETVESTSCITQTRIDKIRPIMEYLSTHYTEQITMEQIAKEAGLSKTAISSYFRQILSCSVFEYIDMLRISKSCFYLTTTNESITEIALNSGFNSSSYFNRVFKKHMGTSPKEYRNKTLKE